FRTITATEDAVKGIVSIPLEQGNVFRLLLLLQQLKLICLNPFGTGQCLSTITATEDAVKGIVSIPFGTGAMSFR
ncbi:hypothetical protein, partial [Haemophilus haemolyticus]|uniref:hypothetical protein n=1 Tax=Haemophilus haemolyticus TaxID=726 RepID=UPI00051996D9